MSNKNRYMDHTPFLKMAGVTAALDGVTSDQSLRQDVYFKVIFIK